MAVRNYLPCFFAFVGSIHLTIQVTGRGIGSEIKKANIVSHNVIRKSNCTDATLTICPVETKRSDSVLVILVCLKGVNTFGRLHYYGIFLKVNG